MEDIISTLLEVVRAQHAATEGSDEKPFDLDDVVDMVFNINGRPEEPEKEEEMAESIREMARSMAPDIFPPKTFEEMDDEQKVASVASMIEERLRQGIMGNPFHAGGQGSVSTDGSFRNGRVSPETNGDFSENSSLSHEDESSDYSSELFQSESGTDAFNPKEAADLNDLIYNNFMQMMGLSEPKVEYPFDRSQIRYGREKSVTEMLAEEEAEKKRAEQQRKPVSAWELAQAAIDQDEAAHQKEEPEVKKMELPETKSASQLAAEAIARAQEEDKMKMEAEKRAERLMEEARKRGKDPMEFALHQQEILNYMEKNSDELVSFEDYEDLSPEEKLEIEKQLYREKQLAAGVSPEDIPEELPDEVLEQAGLDAASSAAASSAGQEGTGEAGQAAASFIPVFSDEMLRQISSEVVGENESMILEEDPDADLDSINESIFQNLKQLMESTGGAPVTQEDLETLIGEVIARNTEADSEAAQAEPTSLETARAEPAPLKAAQAVAVSENVAEAAQRAAVSENVAEAAQRAAVSENAAQSEDSLKVTVQSEEFPEGAVQSERDLTGAMQQETEQEPTEPSFRQPISAVELAKAAQAAAKPEPGEVKEGISAVELAREAQESAMKIAQANMEEAEDPDELSEDDLNFDEMEFSLEEDSGESEAVSKEGDSGLEAVSKGEGGEPETDSREEDGEPEVPSREEDDEPETVSKGEDSEPQVLVKAEPDADVLKPEENVTAEKISGDAGEEEYEYVDPDELVLGEHTQAEIDEALENLETLGLTGEVYERAKRLLLLELAGSEAVLDAWLSTQENGRKKKAAVSALDRDDDKDGFSDSDDFDEDDLERELTLAMDGDFDLEEEAESDEAESGKAENGEAEDGDAEDGDSESAFESQKAATVGAEEAVGEAKDSAQQPKAAAGSPVADAGEEQNVHEEYISDGNIQVEPTRPAQEEKTSVRKEKDEKPGRTRERRNIVKRKEKTTAKKEEKPMARLVPAGTQAQKKEFQVSINHPFVLKNSANFMDKFEEYIADTQENRRLSTGFKSLDAMLRYGLHKGSYFIDAAPQYLKNGFMQQMADRAAENGVDVLYISTELSRYDLMVESISRLSYEISDKDADKAVSAMAIMTGEDGASLASLKDELNWYRGRISEHLFILDQEAVEEYVESMENASAGAILEELIRSMVTEGAHKPVVFIDNLENILSAEDSGDMEPLMNGIRKLAGELGIPIVLSYGYAQAESDEEFTPEEEAFHASLGNMCDVYMELKYADMITEDYQEITPEDIREMAEDGELLLVDVLLHRNKKRVKASCQIQAAPKFNYFEE